MGFGIIVDCPGIGAGVSLDTGGAGVAVTPGARPGESYSNCSVHFL